MQLTRPQILAFRQRVNALDARLPANAGSLRVAAWAGLQDSMPRAALLSIHARVAGTGPLALDDPSLAQVWGPRCHAYVIAERDLAVFTFGRLPDSGKIRERALDLAQRVHVLLDGNAMRYDDAGVALGTHGNNLRYAALTGTLAIRWEGARRPTIWSVPAPTIEPAEATRELARRFLHVFGPTTAAAFAKWGGVGAAKAARTFKELNGELVHVRTPFGDARLLAGDEALLREAAPARGVRLLPSGDAYTLGVTPADRALLLPDTRQQAELWTPRVWPGAVLVDGDVIGTWRRSKRTFTVETWRKPPAAVREAIVAEAEALPLPDDGPTAVSFG